MLTTQGKAAEAEKLLTDILAADPANATALSGISGILLAQNRTDRLIELIKERGRWQEPPEPGGGQPDQPCPPPLRL